MADLSNLGRPFESHQLQQQTRGGRQFTYIPVHFVIERLNDVLGVGKWSLDSKVGRDPQDPDWIIARVTLSGEGFSVTHYGGTEAKRSRQDGSLVSLSDDFKSAVSDALKKAAQCLGVGLDLAMGSEPSDARHEARSATEGLSEDDIKLLQDWLAEQNWPLRISQMSPSQARAFAERARGLQA